MHHLLFVQLTAVNHLQGAFDEARLYSRYHPSKGYSWEFKETETKDPEEESKKSKKKEKAKEETSSLFQRQRVDILLTDLTRKFPPKVAPANPAGAPPANPSGQPALNDGKSSAPSDDGPKVEIKVEIKTEPTNKQPPEKKARLGWRWNTLLVSCFSTTALQSWLLKSSPFSKLLELVMRLN